ncbi:MAG: Asp-tRNA(Asn)/Glu-tRNA(Gln) amidotransferase subunit GatC [Acutalibacteraceae bacterium]|nr:Asp-tRNA(Asn)/Glu-tRNA(Gln) amidotransferase subunit GatC [Acutalibacteraceae bacterium]
MVSHEEIIQLARLAKLSVTEDELDALTAEMQGIIDFADAINNAPVNTGDFDNINNLSNAFREDVVVESYPTEEILANADSKADDCFLVKKESLK